MTHSISPMLVPTSRLSPPRRGRGVLSRPRLESLAPQLLERSLTLLKAPAGFGKTTLAAVWVESLSSPAIRCAWLSLDEQDDSPASLLYAIAGALQNTVDAPLASFKLAQDLPFTSTNLLANQLLNDIEALDKPLLLVLDDCHLLSESTLNKALKTLLRHAPHNLHWLLISRTHLPDKLINYVQGEPTVELDAEDLRFQYEETKALLNRAGIEITAADLAQLQEATEGWSTALRAYMLGASNSKKSLSQVPVPRSLNLLFDEVLEGLEAEFLTKLLALSQLEGFNLALLNHCFAHTGEALLAELEHGQFFLSLKDEQDQQPWYSFHPLFKNYLAERYAKAASEEESSHFRLSAAHWLAEHGQRIAAITLALASGEIELAEQWISRCAMDLVEQGELYTLMQWEKQLREQLSELPPVMRLALGWAAGLAMQQEKGQQLLNSLKGNTQINLWEYRALKAMLLAFSGRGEMAGKLALECLPHFHNQPWIENVLINVQRYGYLHTANWQAFYNLPPLASQLSRSRYVFNRLYQYGIEAIAEIQQARLGTANKQLELAMEVLEENHADNPMLYALPHAFLASIALLKGDYDPAQSHLDKCQPYISPLGFPEMVLAATGCQVQLYIKQKKYPQARLEVEKIEALGLKRLCPILLSFALRHRCQLSVLEGKKAEAKACQQLLQQLFQEQPAPPLELRFARVVTQLSIILAYPEDKTLGEPIQEAELLASTLASFGLQLQHVELQLLIALVLKVKHEPSAQQRLEHWQQVAQVYGLQGVLDNLGLTNETGTQVTDSAALLSLTVKERLILEEVALGHSNKEVAKTMGVAPETIKTHLKNIYAKLGVGNRTQAALALESSKEAS